MGHTKSRKPLSTDRAYREETSIFCGVPAIEESGGKESDHRGHKFHSCTDCAVAPVASSDATRPIGCDIIVAARIGDSCLIALENLSGFRFQSHCHTFLVYTRIQPSDSTHFSMQTSLAQVEALTRSNAKLEKSIIYLRSAPEPPSLPSCRPSKYNTTQWQSLRPYLKSRDYRLITQRDMAAVVSEATGEPIPDHWKGPPKDDDELYCASSVRRPLPHYLSCG
jgi:hypothetical protein